MFLSECKSNPYIYVLVTRRNHSSLSHCLGSFQVIGSPDLTSIMGYKQKPKYVYLFREADSQLKLKTHDCKTNVRAHFSLSPIYLTLILFLHTCLLNFLICDFCLVIRYYSPISLKSL